MNADPRDFHASPEPAFASAAALPAPHEAPSGPNWGKIAKGLIGPLIFLLLKGKTILALILKGKILGPLITSVVSIAAYSMFFGWWFAALFVAQLFVHEIGHVLELRRQGIKASAPIFIPFIGAVVAMKELPPDARREAQIALAGPIAGGLAATGVGLLGWAWQSDLLLAAAYTGFFLNLFNLIPLTPLDGGRVVAALHPALWGAGALAVALLVIVLHSPILVLIGLLGMADAWRRWRERGKGGEAAAYYTVPRPIRWLIGFVYAALAAGFVWGMMLTHVQL